MIMNERMILRNATVLVAVLAALLVVWRVPFTGAGSECLHANTAVLEASNGAEYEFCRVCGAEVLRGGMAVSVLFLRILLSVLVCFLAITNLKLKSR